MAGRRNRRAPRKGAIGRLLKASRHGSGKRRSSADREPEQKRAAEGAANWRQAHGARHLRFRGGRSSHAPRASTARRRLYDLSTGSAYSAPGATRLRQGVTCSRSGCSRRTSPWRHDADRRPDAGRTQDGGAHSLPVEDSRRLDHHHRRANLYHDTRVFLASVACRCLSTAIPRNRTWCCARKGHRRIYDIFFTTDVCLLSMKRVFRKIITSKNSSGRCPAP